MVSTPAGKSAGAPIGPPRFQLFFARRAKGGRKKRVLMGRRPSFTRNRDRAVEEFTELLYRAKEGDVGAYWGLWDKDGNLKYV